MAESLTIEIIVKEIIKPCFPTPHDLKHLKLSLLDQVAPATYTPLLLFYPATDVVETERSDRLKSSLSYTLSRFYPLAGKAKHNLSIECTDDDGADFIEARANCLLSDILKQPNADVLKEFLPIEIDSTDAVNGRVLLVHSTFFECGGMAIGVSMSHKMADASSLSTFIKSWSSDTAAHLECSSDHVVVELPQFMGASLFPPPTGFSMPIPELGQDVKCVTRRLVFDASKIIALKAKAASESAPQPTRVEAVTGLIWKCAMKASRSTSTTPKVLSVLSQTVNLRKRIVPPLPETSMGNLLGNFTAQTSEEIDLKCLVGRLRDGIREFNENGVKNYQGSDDLLTMWGTKMKESGKLLQRDDVDFYICSSWSKFNMYDADFGWGKPIWMSIASLSFSNFIVLMDTRDGHGIEAWVTLRNVDEMTSFERDQELLQFASFNLFTP